MPTTIGFPPGPERTHALLEELISGRRALMIRAQVLNAKEDATPEEVEEAFQEACVKAASRCHGQTMGEVYKWLHRTTDSAFDDLRDRRKHEVLVDPSAGDFEDVDATLGPTDELLIKRDERAEVDKLTLAILDRLHERERNIAVLHSHGLARKEIASHLSVSPRVVKRSIEELLAVGRTQLTKLVGYGCPDGHDLVARYAFGLAVDREARRAQLHLMTCPRCGAMYEGLDLWRDRVAALLPLPPVAAANPDVVERVVHAGTDLVATRPPTEESPAGIRRHAAGIAGHLRDQAMATYYRTVDPTPIAGLRPGAVAAAVAGCLAIGGGATYCVKQGTDPFTAFSHFTAPEQQERKKPKPRRDRARAAQAPAPPVVTPTVQTPPPAPTTTPAPPTTTQATALPPAPEDEYEPTSPGATATTSTKPRREPQPAPAEGPIGEFDGP